MRRRISYVNLSASNLLNGCRTQSIQSLRTPLIASTNEAISRKRADRFITTPANVAYLVMNISKKNKLNGKNDIAFTAAIGVPTATSTRFLYLLYPLSL